SGHRRRRAHGSRGGGWLDPRGARQADSGHRFRRAVLLPQEHRLRTFHGRQLGRPRVLRPGGERTMTKKRTRWLSFGLAMSSLLAVSLGGASADEDPENLYAGRAQVYRQLPAESLESLSTPEAIRAVTMPNVAPSKIWRV